MPDDDAGIIIIISKRAGHTSDVIRPRALCLFEFSNTPPVGPGDSDLYSKLRTAFTRITTIGFGAEGKLYAQPVQEVQGQEFKTC